MGGVVVEPVKSLSREQLAAVFEKAKVRAVQIRKQLLDMRGRWGSIS